MKSFLVLLLICVYVDISAVCANENQTRSRPNQQRTAASTNGFIDRVYDRMAALTTLDEQQLRKLEALEYKMSRFEHTNEERTEAIRDELKEITRKIQNLDYLQTKSDGALEQLKYEVEEIRRHLDSHGTRLQTRQVQSSEPDCSDKLTALATLLTSTRAAVNKIERSLDSFGANMTQLLQFSREIHQRQHTLPTKQYLTSALHSSRNQPVYALMHGQQQFNPQYSGSSSPLPTSCAHVSLGQSGIHRIQVDSVKGPFYVQCDGETQDGGWTVIQRRKDGSVNFNRHWLEYKNGFGNIAGEFFIGLDKLNDMTSASLHELLIVLEDFENVTRYAKYSSFAIGGEKDDYALNILGEYEGTAGDSLSFSASYKFSTFDNDNDGWVEGNCAQAHTGAWWYNACEMSNLNGQYFNGDVPGSHQFQGVYWNEFHGPTYSLKDVKMMIRPVDRLPSDL